MKRILAIFVISAATSAYGQSVWQSPNEHYFGAASCHPHCHDDQGDIFTWQEPYPPDLDSKTFSVACHGNGHSGNPCAFDPTSVSLDKTRHIATVTFTNRSDEVWLRLTAK